VFVPLRFLFPVLGAVVVFGIYGVNYSVFDVGVGLFFGVVGYLFEKLRYPAVPMLLGIVLCPILEQNLRRALITSDSNFGIFIERPISLVLLLATAALLLWPVLTHLLKKPSPVAG